MSGPARNDEGRFLHELRWYECSCLQTADIYHLTRQDKLPWSGNTCKLQSDLSYLGNRVSFGVKRLIFLGEMWDESPSPRDRSISGKLSSQLNYLTVRGKGGIWKKTCDVIEVKRRCLTSNELALHLKLLRSRFWGTSVIQRANFSSKKVILSSIWWCEFLH